MGKLAWLIAGGAAFGAGFVAELRRGEEGAVSIEEQFDSYALDTSGDGQADTYVAQQTISADVDGDGLADVVESTTSVGVDLDGDGVVDVVETSVATAVDMNGDGELDDVTVEDHLDAVSPTGDAVLEAAEEEAAE